MEKENYINFFKQEAKKLFKDYNTREFNENEGWYDYHPRYYEDLENILDCFNIQENKFTLMNAQHIIARLSGFYNWNELREANEPQLELGKLLLTNRLAYEEKLNVHTNMTESLLVDHWKRSEQEELKDLDDWQKLELFKKLFPEFSYINLNNKITLNFEDDEDVQDMISKITHKKNITAEKAITSSITQRNCIRIIESGFAKIASTMWGHDNPEAIKDKLDKPIIEVKLSKEKKRLVDLIIDKEEVSYQQAIICFLTFELEHLGYHI